MTVTLEEHIVFRPKDLALRIDCANARCGAVIHVSPAELNDSFKDRLFDHCPSCNAEWRQSPSASLVVKYLEGLRGIIKEPTARNTSTDDPTVRFHVYLEIDAPSNADAPTTQ